MRVRLAQLAFTALTVSALPAFAQGNSAPPQRHAYFGELHLHTVLSFDAWTFGTKVTPDQAYKFAKGQTVMIPAAQLAKEEGYAGQQDVPAKRAWPLDFTAVTDHAEYMGATAQLSDPNSAFSKSDLGKKITADAGHAFMLVGRMLHQKPPQPDLAAAAATSHAWDIQMKATQDNYEPGKFTTILAYEFTASAKGGQLHRNVLFDADHAPQPFSSADSDRPEDLWTYLDSVRAHGIDCISIPHNGNLGDGLMYDWNDSDGKPIDEAYAQRRALNEPLTEIIQNKGQSDTTPVLAPNDEFANFEVLAQVPAAAGKKGSYVREALGRGLVLQAQLGTNPYKYGLVGGTDIHNGLTTSDENAFAGGAWGIDPKTMLPKGDAAKVELGIPVLDKQHVPSAGADGPWLSAGGLTGVWAEQNTRDSIFAALKRKETFATSGPRIRVHMFAGWNFDPKMMASKDWPTAAYEGGVPMGSDLPAAPGASAPKFALSAVKDPDGANLDRIQIIKVWLDGSDYKEKIFDVALSDKRKVDPASGKAPAVGNTVDLKTAEYSNRIGATELSVLWQDPEFDPSKAAVYYARVLQIPTPRWTTILAAKSQLPIPSGVAATIQERAWSSPIWYTPTK